MSARWVGIILLLMGGQAAGQGLSESHFKFVTARNVYTAVAASFGGSMPKPPLVMVPTQSKKRVIARYVGGVVEIDETVYDLCRGFGADSLAALACVLGHELAHYYLRHTSSESFSQLLIKPLAEVSTDRQKETAMIESQADYHGAFQGFLAGYPTYRVIAALYEKIYQAYHLPEKVPGYPSRQDRIAIAGEKATAIARMAPLVETARFLVVKGDYTSAARCYKYLLTQFPSQQMYNNLGVCYLQQAATHFVDEQAAFAYPFELDPVNRLLNIHTRGDRVDATAREALLSHAQENFQQAIHLDNTYASAHINLATVQSLQNVPSASIGTIDLLQRYTEGELPANAYLVRGIAYVRNEQLDAAGLDFEKARQGSAFQSDYNYALFQQLKRSWWEGLEEWIQDYFSSAPQPSKARPLPPATAFGNHRPVSPAAFKPVVTLPFPDPVSVHHYQELGFSYVKIETASQQLELVASGSMVSADRWKGKTVREWLKKYRPADVTFVFSQGYEMHLYRQNRIILESKDNIITGWMIWQSAPLNSK
ncbi:M48 family metalloprotease [Parachryseolinea silvisoli]|uniref:hypothetical protein n=1 Tax=Parachryseolinea silvisoli TaxID=2873601 RepID=UPI0022658493|nr:hypothetical protein [Parachryseolinea silvisoli]MCD9015347.1 hypothetical protein [Parachryseolinea silvisoli]